MDPRVEALRDIITNLQQELADARAKLVALPATTVLAA